MRKTEALIVMLQSLLYGGAARSLQRLIVEPRLFWPAAASLTFSLLATLDPRNGSNRA